MEIIRKTILTYVLAMLAIATTYAQNDSDLVKAFSISYSEELKTNYSAAIKAISPVYDDDNYEANLRMGWLYYLAKNYNASGNYYLKAISLKSSSLEARFGLVKPLAALESWDKVMAQYDAILKLDNQNSQANYWKGTIFYTRKQYSQAKQQFAKVLNLYPFDYDANYMQGWTHIMLGDKGAARACFSKALMSKPGDMNATDGLLKSK